MAFPSSPGGPVESLIKLDARGCDRTFSKGAPDPGISLERREDGGGAG